MGLDVVEFVMEVEETFRVRFEDSELEQMQTFGQFNSAIARKLGRRRGGACLSSAIFYRMRRALGTRFGVARRQVVPSAQVEDLLPRQGRRRHWADFGHELGDFRLPPLERPRWLTIALLVVSSGLILTGIVQGGIDSPTLPSGWFFVLGGIASGILGYHATKPFAVRIPPDCATMRRAALTLLFMNHGRIWQAAGYVSEAEVWPTLRALLAENSGVAQELITPDKKFRDIGF